MLRGSVLFYVICFGVIVLCHPTVYRMKDNKVLEPDLVPVSSTVIPLPSYQVGYGFNVSEVKKYHKFINHQEPKLLTDENKKKYYYGEKKHGADLKSKS